MAQVDLSAVMDALALAVSSTPIKRVYPYPPDAITVPCVIVGYPTDLAFDATFGRGSDGITLPIFFVAGKASDRNTREELSQIIAGTDSIKEAIAGDLDGAVNSAEVTNASITTITMNAVDYIAVEFTTEILT